MQTAIAASSVLDSIGRKPRADLLDTLAAALEDDRAGIVEVADRESRLGTPRLDGELTRTCFQLRLFGEVLREGSYVEATIDPAGQTPAGARPDLRRMLVPLGPVAVFGASNFPLAFSVPGGDTASAIAAGCAVVVKAHPSHLETSRRTHQVLRDALTSQRLPEDVLGLVEGLEAGKELVQHPGIKAVGFTGSTAGGRALHDLAAARPEPIPFYGELGSLNPLVVTPGAASARAAEIAAGYVGSMTLGTGQFCTKPGLMFVPTGDAATAVRTALADAVESTVASPMLNDAIHRAFESEIVRRRADRRLELVAEGASDGDGCAYGSPALFRVAAADLSGELLEECFGPSALLVEYASIDELTDALNRLGGQLTASVHATDEESELVTRLHTVLRDLAGRLVFDGYPTGVAVSWAMQHGGSYPAATVAGHTSVGASAIRRWLRPVVYQNAPSYLLPPELQDDNPAGIPRRVDGVLQSAST